MIGSGRRRNGVASAFAALAILFCAVPNTVQAASPAWKLLSATGPTNIPPTQSEVQRLLVEGEGGTFTLSRPKSTVEATPVVYSGEMRFTAGSPEVTVVGIESGGSLEVGDRMTGGSLPGYPEEVLVVSCTPDCNSAGSTVTLSAAPETTEATAAVQIFTKELAGVTGDELNVGEEIAETVLKLSGASGEYFPPGTVVTAVGTDGLTLSNPTTYQYFSFLGALELSTPPQTTGAIPYDATAGQVESELTKLPALGPGSVTVSGGPGGSAATPYAINFGGDADTGPLAYQDVGQLIPDGGGLAGDSAGIHVTTVVPGGAGTGAIEIAAANIGGSPTVGEYSVELGPLPAGIVTSGPAEGDSWNCPGGAGQSSVVCTSTEPKAALRSLPIILVPIEVTRPAVAPITTPVLISGGGGGAATFQLPITVSAEDAPPGLQAFWAGAFNANGETETQAGGHPFSAQTYFALNTIRSNVGKIIPAADSREVTVEVPPGFLGNPLATLRCPQAQLGKVYTETESADCNEEMTVGQFSALVSVFGTTFPTAPIRNDVPAIGSAAEFTTTVANVIQNIFGSVRSSEDFGVNVVAPNNPTFAKIYGSYVALEGAPAGGHGRPFLDNPTDCSVQREESLRGEGPGTVIEGKTWQQSEPSTRIDPLPLITGCRALTDAWLGQGPEPANGMPSFSFQPSTTQASSPTGATATLHIPQDGLEKAGKLRTADLKKAVVTLPKGLSVNPSSANGLEACSESQVGYLGSAFLSPNPMRFNENSVTCPDASKLGTFSIKTPLLKEEVGGTIYLAAQEENPFNSLIALYLVVENERFGLTLKLPGEVRPDPNTGQLRAVFDNNPQLPFENLTLHFRGGGGRATLATPETCGHFETTGSLEPWSAENGEALAIHEGGFDVSSNCSSSESTRPFAPGFEAGTVGTKAGAYSPLVLKVTRKDGEQELKSLDFTLPKGLTGKLAGIPYCPEGAIKNAEGKSGKAEQASASCPASSQIGTVDTSGGVGSEPIHVGGKVYLAGPYKGAPLSSVVVTPAVAGPFDLGDVVIRAPIYVDPETAEITVKSDPIPTILKGIPLKVRSVAINLDRSLFTLNPTSCNVMEVTSTMQGSSGATAKPANRFQVDGCKQLKFKPRLKISLRGATKRAGLPALKAVVTYPKKGAYANIRRAQVNLPHSEFLEQNNLNKTCTRPVLLEGKCPKSTIYGKAKAWTPLLDKPLQGPVYLVGGYGYKLPALVAELNGQIRILLKGKVDSGKNKGIRNTFEAVPDAPVSRFVLEMKGGKKYGLLINSENLCAKPQRAIARFAAQNGMVQQSKPKIANQCGNKKHRKHGKHKAKRGDGGKAKPKKH